MNVRSHSPVVLPYVRTSSTILLGIGRRLAFSTRRIHPGQAFVQRKENPRYCAAMSAEAEEKKA